MFRKAFSVQTSAMGRIILSKQLWFSFTTEGEFSSADTNELFLNSKFVSLGVDDGQFVYNN